MVKRILLIGYTNLRLSEYHLLFFLFTNDEKTLRTTQDIFISEKQRDKLALAFRSSRPKVFCKKAVLRNFAKFRGFAKFLRTPFLTEHLWWLLFSIVDPLN